MSSLSDAYDRDGRARSVAWAVCLLAGSLVTAVGTVATAASLIVGLGVAEPTAFRVATVLGGAVPLAVFLGPQIVAPAGWRSLTLAAAGALAGVFGLGLFWATYPAGWTGTLTGLPPVVLTTYAAGLVSAFAARLVADDAEGEQSYRVRGIRTRPAGEEVSSLGSVVGSNSGADGEGDYGDTVRVEVSGSTAVGTEQAASPMGDGGEDDTDVEFFDADET